MALTKIQPSGLDATLDYSVHKLTVSGVDVLGYAQSAFLQANTVYNVANTLSPEDTFARTQANAAFTQANTGVTNAATANTNAAIADGKAVTAGSYANAAFSVANTAYGWGNHASAGYATTGYVTSEISNLIDNAPGALDTLNELAAALGDDANFSTTITNMVSATGSYANSAFVQANTATTNAATADSKAVTAGSYANSAFAQANTATTNALAASSYANSAFAQANTDYTTVSATAGVYGGSSNIPVITLEANGRVSAIVNTSISIPAGTSVYGNTGQITANAATGTVALGLATTAVTPGSYTSSSITVDEYGRITAAANGAGGGGSVSITNDTTTNANTYYPMLSTATSGSLSTANTANTKLYFNPSTGTLNSTIFNSLSDKNLKTEMVQITNALDKIKQLTGYVYTIIESGERSAGLLSQDVQRVLPEAVRENNGTQSLNYNATIGLLAEGIKELSDKIDEINRKLG